MFCIFVLIFLDKDRQQTQVQQLQLQQAQQQQLLLHHQSMSLLNNQAVAAAAAQLQTQNLLSRIQTHQLTNSLPANYLYLNSALSSASSVYSVENNHTSKLI